MAWRGVAWRGENAIPIRGHVALYAVAVVYYASFLLNTQAMEWRYYAPSFFVFLVVGVDLIVAAALDFRHRSYQPIQH